MIPTVLPMQALFPIPAQTAMDMAHRNPMERALPVVRPMENPTRIPQERPIPIPIAVGHQIPSVMVRATGYRTALPEERPIPTATELRPATRSVIPTAHLMGQPTVPPIP